MVKVSSNFKQAIYKPERTTKGRVSFEILDVEAYEDASITVSGSTEISRENQVINKIREMTHRYATFEQNYFALNGSCHIPPEGFKTFNILEEQSSSGEGTGGFVSQTESSYSFDTTTKVFGNQSVKVFISDATRINNGIRTNRTTNMKKNTEYVASVYLRGEGIVELRVQEWLGTSYLRDFASQPITLTDTWTRYEIKMLSSNDSDSLCIAVRNPVNNGATQTFWADGFQLEEAKGRDTARPWTLGGTPIMTAVNSELGWWSEQLSGEDGSFIVSPYLDFNFASPHSSIGLTITFDTAANEYPTEFRLEVFDPLGNVIINELITGNENTVFLYEKPIANYQRIRITILKYVKPSRRAKIVEVDFGVIREYTGEKLISLKVLEDMDLLANTVPSNEMSFVLDNSDNAFNILNPNGIYHFLKPNQEMKASIGLLVDGEKLEYVPMGKYYLTEWTVEEGSMTSTFVGRDIFTRLDAVEYTNLLQNTNLYDLAVDILIQANVDGFKIDESLKKITTVGFREKIKTREALQMVAMASKCAIRQDRDGAVVIEKYEELAFETGYITFAGPDVYAGMTTPQTNVDYTFQAIDFENAFEAPKVTLTTAVAKLIFKIKDAAGAEFDVQFLNSKVAEGKGQGYEINNPLINTEEHAREIAEYMFKEYNAIAEYQANWRQNPALECGNVILIEDSFGGKRKSRIIKQEFEFAGYLQGVTEARGGV